MNLSGVLCANRTNRFAQSDNLTTFAETHTESPARIPDQSSRLSLGAARWRFFFSLEMLVSMSRTIVVQTTTGNSADAEKLAEIIIANAQGACVQIVGPMTSVYRWQGTIQRDEEFLVSIKTTSQVFPTLAELIRQHHTYDVPKIIAIPIIDGSSEYLEWVAQSVT